MLHELESHDNSIFLTLTYDDDNLPKNKSLDKEELKKFFKRLRYHLKDRKIKYFACGEYGEKSKMLRNGYITVGERPHYHTIIFGMSLDIEDKMLIIDNWNHCDWTNEKIYNNSFGLAEADSIRYVAQYIDKKYTGDLAVEEYDDKEREPVFKICSNGIGKNHVINNCEQYVDNLFMTVNGVKMSFPRYYCNILGLTRSQKESIKNKVKEKEIDLVEDYSSKRLDRDQAYKKLTVGEVLAIEDRVSKSRQQREKNLKSKLDLRNRSSL